MEQLNKQVRLVRNRQQKQWLWQCISSGLLAGGLATSAIAGINLALDGGLPWTWLLAPIAIGPVAGAFVSLIQFKSLRNAAQSIDKQAGLKDRFATALQFLERSKRETLSSVHQLQLEDANEHANRIEPSAVAPVHAPKSWSWAIAATLIAGVLAFYPQRQPQSIAPLEVNAVVDRQADRIENGLEELEALQQEQPDVELEKLVKDLKQVLEQLKEPGVDPKEALAKLSEMETSLMQMQQKLDDPQSLAELQQIGEALTLSPTMSQAGQALSKGDMDKAAEALEKLELPELDRQTEKAVVEKLEQAKKEPNNSKDGSPKSAIQQAAEQMAQGISQGNRGKFSDGAKGLAGEAKKKSSKKKLSDLLKKQCQCLGECKSECENECRNSSSCSKPGGSKAGTSSADKSPGDKTAMLKTGEQMKLKGQESTQGDSEIETQTGNEQEEQVTRSYREQVAKYEALSESALESESIPLGQRQTIRKYFELIRPTSTETDQVKDQTEQK